jgi:hypothetical protein
MNIKQGILFSLIVILFGSCNWFSISKSCSIETKPGIDSLDVDFNTENQQELEKENIETDSVLQNGKVIVLNANNYINMVLMLI